MIRVGSLCSGSGGLELGVAMIWPHTVAWHSENDPHPSAVLEAHWPHVPNLGDLTTVDWTAVEPVDLLTAGYPCQPFSQAGKRKGTADERHIWPAVARAVRHLRPRHVVLENVANHLRLGFGDVLGDLATLGYDARWTCLRAADAGAPHARLRVFILATDTRGEAGRVGPDAPLGRDAVPDASSHPRRLSDGDGRAPADPDGDGLELVRRERPDERHPYRRRGADVAWGDYEPAIRRWEHTLGRTAPAPTEPGRNGPRLSPRFVEWLMGLPAGWVTDIPGLPRNAQLRILGNGVVPQQAALALHTLRLHHDKAAA